jgi:hypothetical protein
MSSGAPVPYVRFDERRWEAGSWDGLRHRRMVRTPGTSYSPRRYWERSVRRNHRQLATNAIFGELQIHSEEPTRVAINYQREKACQPCERRMSFYDAPSYFALLAEEARPI